MAQYHTISIAKIKTLKADNLPSGHRGLDLLGNNIHAPRYLILKQATKFIAKRIGRKAAPKLKCLPPTSESHAENVWRAHYQVATWKASLSGELPISKQVFAT